MNHPEMLAGGRPQAETPQLTTVTTGGFFEPCQECGAPMERLQRYCVQCAARRADVANPAARYFAAASRRRRNTTAGRAGAATPGPTPNATRAAGVFFFALLPIAVAVGVVVGRGGSGPDEEELLAALRDGNVTAAAGAGAGNTTKTASNPSDLLTSDFSLDEGFTVKIGSLPIDSTDQAGADDAKSEAEGKGAKDVGIINPGDFVTKPDQGQQDYILYSGEFEERADAEQALGDLKKEFPDAEVIEVTSSSAASGGASGGGADLNQNRVVAQTSHGTVHEVTAAPPSQEQIEHDTAIVNEIANETGQDYIETQQELPDVVVVGGDPEDAPPLPTGVGD